MKYIYSTKFQLKFLEKNKLKDILTRNFACFFTYISDIAFFRKNILNFIENFTKCDKIANE